MTDSPHQDYEFSGRENDIATLATIMNIAERMSTIPPHSPSSFGFSSFELRCLKLAVVDFGSELLERVKRESHAPETPSVSTAAEPENR
jgi:hypothetical protein